MTLPESLARKALPCPRNPDAHDPNSCPACSARPAVEAVLREAIEACAVRVETMQVDTPDRNYQKVAMAAFMSCGAVIRFLLADEETP